MMSTTTTITMISTVDMIPLLSGFRGAFPTGQVGKPDARFPARASSAAMSLVALSAAYGAGGTVVGPQVAERLGVPFIDRAIPLQVAERLEVPVEHATAHDEESPESFFDRLLRGFIGTDIGVPAPVPPETFTSEDFRRATEQVLLTQARSGEGVILGRAAVIVLRDDPRALRVRLDGPPELRVVQAMRLGEADEETARSTVRKLDRAHAEYARQFYGTDIRDPSLYHLVLDSTAIGLEHCVELILAASRALS
jgi:cytidylate kinase